MSRVEPHTARSTTLVDRYREVRALTEALASPLSPEDQTVQSMPDCSPTKWHRAHVTWFFETFLLQPRLPGYRVFHPAYPYLFNSYYETAGPRHPRPRRGLISRPGVEEVATYRAHVDQAMAALLEDPLDPEASWLATLGFNHEQQHQELLLMDAKHLLAQNPLGPGYLPLEHPPSGRLRPLEWVEHPGGLAEIGHDRATDGDAPPADFAFDNEEPRHRTYLEPFALANRAVAAGEWVAFIEDGGYRRPDLWLSDGWATVQAEGWDAPLYWSREGQDWQVFTLGGRRPLDPAEPVVHVSYFEADAFARWAGARLPTEAEWEVVADETLARSPGAAPGAPDQASTAPRFLDPDVLHPRPAPDGEGPVQLLGDVWEWTASPYSAYPGFRPAAGAVGEYNGKFMVNQQVLRGGCCATPPGHVRPTYRNFFPPQARWAFSGLRLAADR